MIATDHIFFFFNIQGLTFLALFFNICGIGSCFLQHSISTFVDISVEITMHSYEIILNHLKEVLDVPTFNNWILPLSLIGFSNDILFLGSPDTQKTKWIQDNILQDLNSFSFSHHKFTVKIVPLYPEESSHAIPDQKVRNPFPDLKFETNLKKKYTFDSFVQTDANRMAYSFAYSVSEFPGKSYNPLYIYSDVGLGKTHLMQAVGNRILSIHPDLNVIYTTTSEFMHEYVEFNRLNKRPEFIKKYTSIYVLLIDDIQYITKWG